MVGSISAGSRQAIEDKVAEAELMARERGRVYSHRRSPYMNALGGAPFGSFEELASWEDLEAPDPPSWCSVDHEVSSEAVHDYCAALAHLKKREWGLAVTRLLQVIRAKPQGKSGRV